LAKGKKLGNYQRITEAKRRATAEAVRPIIIETAYTSPHVLPLTR
jgi:hypothetical protein